METRSVSGRWILLGLSVFILTNGANVLFPARQAFATNHGSDTEKLNATQPAAQQQIPPDHYDPDDTKTWPDVSYTEATVVIRGKQFTAHFYRPQKDGPAQPAIYACGDGGWRGLAPRTAQQLAHQGLAVAGIDSKIYLREFASLQAPLTISQIASDYAEVAWPLRTYAKVGPTTPVYVYGWSLGAGFAVAVGADTATRENWAGIITIGLPKQNQLVSGVGANYSDLSSEQNSNRGFLSQDVMPRVSPLPLVMIQSTSDTASPPRIGRALFASARDPKRYVLIKASNHRFSGARDEFYAALGDAVSWIHEASKTSNVAISSRQQSPK